MLYSLHSSSIALWCPDPFSLSATHFSFSLSLFYFASHSTWSEFLILTGLGFHGLLALGLSSSVGLDLAAVERPWVRWSTSILELTGPLPALPCWSRLSGPIRGYACPLPSLPLYPTRYIMPPPRTRSSEISGSGTAGPITADLLSVCLSDVLLRALLHWAATTIHCSIVSVFFVKIPLVRSSACYSFRSCRGSCQTVFVPRFLKLLVGLAYC